MPQCLIIADDLTGANATGVLLHKAGYSAYTVLELDGAKDIQSECDCLLYPTNSRSRTSEEAYRRVFEATKKLKSADTKVYAKRIDSTLRGNLGRETDAMLDALGENYTALVAPSFPSSGRIVCGGYMLVNSVPLHKTSAAVDPKNPIDTSRVEDIFRRQSKYPVASVDLGELRKGKAYVAERITALAKEGIRTILFDCITDDDLELIAGAGIASGIPFISVGPGPFTAALVKSTIAPRIKNDGGSVLLVIGSVNGVAKMQIDEVLPSRDIFVSLIKIEELIKSDESRQAEIRRNIEAIAAAAREFRIYALIGEGIDPDKRVDFTKYEKRTKRTSDELSDIVNSSFAAMAAEILRRQNDIKALYTSGGDITLAVYDELRVSSIKLHTEVLPLTAYGELCGGDFDGLKVITKGGMAGDKYALKDCIAYLTTHI